MIAPLAPVIAPLGAIPNQFALEGKKAGQAFSARDKALDTNA